MAWELNEALDYYRGQGAPGDQNALISLLKEVQEESGGRLTQPMVDQVAQGYGLKDSYLLAIIKRLPSLHLDDTHCLELCGGPSCTKRAQLESYVRKTYGSKPEKFTVKTVPCMRMCAKGPNIRWDGTLYDHADEKLIRSLVDPLLR